MNAFEDTMARGGTAAVRHAASFFMKTDPVHQALREVTRRLRDLADVQELICVLKLPRDYAETLNPYVRGKFVELAEGLGADREPNV